MEERSTKFSLIVTGICIALFIVFGLVLKPGDKDKGEGSRDSESAKNQAGTPANGSAKGSSAASPELLPPPPLPAPPPQPPANPAASSGAATPLVAPRAVVKNQQVLTQCTLEEDQQNDADSFRVKCKTGIYRFCLYFVDAPDANGSNQETTAKQAGYFGGISEQELRGVAREAQRFVLDLLRGRKFDVVTRWDPALEESTSDQMAYRAFIYLENGKGPMMNLADMLVENGLVTLARCSEMLPDRMQPETFQGLLQQREQTAITEKRGAWRFSGRLQPASASGGKL